MLRWPSSRRLQPYEVEWETFPGLGRSGLVELIPPLAETALRESEVIVGYELYLTWIRPWIDGKEIHAPALTHERERASLAIEQARNGRVVSLVSSGDIGVYGMAALVLEEMVEEDRFELAVIPGISAATSCASLLGSPLSHDFATLSLSDLLCPWDWIEHRARQLARAEMVVALYNVQSKTRQEGVYRILRLFLEEKAPTTWCGVVRNAYRANQESSVCTLVQLLERRFDMLTTVIVGNRFTQRKREFIFTPRGYRNWNQAVDAKPRNAETSKRRCELPAVWVFSGTSDGNAVASKLQEAGYHIIVSTASEYGREIVTQNLPGITVRSGTRGPRSPPERVREFRCSSYRRRHSPLCDCDFFSADAACRRDQDSLSAVRAAFCEEPVSCHFLQNHERSRGGVDGPGKSGFFGHGCEGLARFSRARRSFSLPMVRTDNAGTRFPGTRPEAWSATGEHLRDAGSVLQRV